MALLLPLPGFCSLPHPKLFSPSLTLDPPQKCFAVSASSINKPRARKKAKSNADLCNDLREFISVVGLPDGHVPSTKDLLEHGRKDLANIVRRRGYKQITELLANSKVADIDGSSKGQRITETCEERLTETRDTSSPVIVKDLEANDLVEDLSSSGKISVEGSHLIGASADSDLSDQDHVALKSSKNLSLQAKVANFIQNGELDSVDQNVLEMGSSNVDDCQTENVHGGRSVNSVLNGRAKADNLTGDIKLSTLGPKGADVNKELDIETNKRENQVEINHLKFMLHQKELELSRLKEEIGKEQLGLSILQTKAETEISEVRKMISEADAELHAAEESLSGLKEVEIQYWGVGELVEVTGSFNGWHHRIKMDLQPSSSSTDSAGSRKLELWTTVLWLYPGKYEIKFIVDGHWRIDPHRESVTSGTIENNVLRVER